MKKEMKKVPAVRFTGFTGDWEQRKLRDIVSEVTRTNEKSIAPVMMITANNGFINQAERYSTNNAGQSLKKYILLRNGELAYNHGASKLRPYGSCFALTTEKEARIPFVYHCFSTDTENPEFLSLVLNGKNVEQQLRKIVSSGARMDGLLNISFEEYTSIPIMIPRREEQDSIADYFRMLDKIITLHQRKYEMLKKIKKSFLEKMFPKNGKRVPELRFSGFTDDWEQRKFSEIVQRESNMRLSSSDFPSVEYEDIVSEAGILNKNISAKNAQKKGIIFDGSQILYGKLRPYLHNWLNPDFNGVAVGDWWVLKPIETDKNFIYRLIQTPEFDDVANQSTGSKMPRADWNLVANTTFMIPANINEQKKIGANFKKIDNLITLHQRMQKSAF